MRRYVNPDSQSPPKPLKTNWPDLGIPVPDCQKVWRYRIRRVDDQHLIYEGKSLEKAQEYLALARRGSTHKLYLEKYTPNEETLHFQRSEEKATWRWQAGFGA